MSVTSQVAFEPRADIQSDRSVCFGSLFHNIRASVLSTSAQPRAMASAETFVK